MDVKELIAYLVTPVVQIALIMGLAEVLKKMGMPKKYIPMFDLVFGIVASIIIYSIGMGYTIIEGIVLGTALGLSACGLFSGIKNVLGGKET